MSTMIKGSEALLDGHDEDMPETPKNADRRTPKTIIFGQRIATLRDAKGLNQKDLGDLLDVSENAVTQYETGRATPRPARLEKMARILGVTTTYLLTGDEPDELVRAQTADELEALNILRAIPIHQRGIALASLRGIAAEITKK